MGGKWQVAKKALIPQNKSDPWEGEEQRLGSSFQNHWQLKESSPELLESSKSLKNRWALVALASSSVTDQEQPLGNIASSNTGWFPAVETNCGSLQVQGTFSELPHLHIPTKLLLFPFSIHSSESQMPVPEDPHTKSRKKSMLNSKADRGVKNTPFKPLFMIYIMQHKMTILNF